jgi:hypothetical protein
LLGTGGAVVLPDDGTDWFKDELELLLAVIDTDTGGGAADEALGGAITAGEPDDIDIGNVW